MGYIIDSKDYINENIFKFEKRLESQYTIFLDRNPTFVTYYHINNINSTTDNGFMNIEQVLGPDCPLRFQKIENFPIYGIEQIQLDLSDDDEGLTSNFEADGIVLPNTIKPMVNDVFTIPYLGNDYLFMVTQISYDTIKSNNFYKINFFLKYTDGAEDIKELQKHVLEHYDCIFSNIGTEDKCIIESDASKKIVELENIYKEFVSRYITLFYNKRFNCLYINNGNRILYDKYISYFVSKHNLLNEKDSYNTIELSNEDDGSHFIIQYEESIFDAIESRDKTRLGHVLYAKVPITYGPSVFNYYHVTDDVDSVVFVPECINECGEATYIDDNIIDNILLDTVPDTSSIIDEMFIKYFNDRYNTIYDFDTERLKLYRVRYTNKDFRLIPVILYIMRDIIDKYLHV